MPQITVTFEWSEHPSMAPDSVAAIRAEIERVLRGGSAQLADHITTTMLPNGIARVTVEVSEIEA